MKTIYIDAGVLLLLVILLQPKVLYIPPAVIVQLVKTPVLNRYDVSSVRVCRTGGAPVKAETEELFKKRFNCSPMVNGRLSTCPVCCGLLVIYPLAHITVDSSGKCT